MFGMGCALIPFGQGREGCRAELLLCSGKNRHFHITALCVRASADTITLWKTLITLGQQD